MSDTVTPDVISLRDESLSTIEREAQAIFDAQDNTRLGQREAPPAPTPKAAPAPEPAPKPAEGSKISGPPGTAGKKAADVTPASAVPDFSDLPKEFVPGQVRNDQWKRLHAKADYHASQEAKSALRVKELEMQLAQKPNVAPETLEQLTAIQKERDDLRARLEAVAVEKSPRFEAQFKPRFDAAVQQAKAAVGPEKAAKIEQLLSMPESSWRDEQLDQVIQDMGTTLRATKLTQAVADVDRLNAEKVQLAQRGSEVWKQWNQEATDAQQRQVQERNAQATNTFESELAIWKGATELSEDEVSIARNVFSGNGMTYKDMANAAMWGVVGPRMAQAALADKARVTELESELARLRGAQPGIKPDGSGAIPDTDPGTEEITSTSYIDRIAKEAVANGFLKR